jgi:hypothetical protein
MAPSSEHSNAEPGSSAENVKLALVLVVSASGPVSMVVSGGSVSTVHE